MQKSNKTFLFLLICLFLVSYPACANQCQNTILSTDDYVKVSMSSDGNFIAAGDPKTGTVSLVSKDGVPEWTYQTCENISGIGISRNGEHIASVSEKGTVLFFDHSGNLLWKSNIKGCMPKVVLSENGSVCLVYNEDLSDDPYTHTLNLFDKTGRKYFSERIPAIDSAVISSDENYFFTGTSFFTKGRMHSSSGETLWNYKTALTSYFSANPRVDASDNFNTIGIAGDSQTICFDKSGNELFSRNVSYWGGSVLYIAVSGSGEYIVAGDRHTTDYMNRTGSLLWNFNPGYLPIPESSSAAVSYDGNVIAICHDNRIFLLDKKRKTIENLVLNYPLKKVLLSDDGNVTAGGTYGGLIYINSGEKNLQFIDINNFSAAELPGILKADDSNVSSESNSESAASPVYFFLPLIAVFLILTFKKRKS